MATILECAHCVDWFFKTKPVTQTQRNYRTHFNKESPSSKTIRDWHQHFVETDHKRNGWPSTHDESGKQIHESFVWDPAKSIWWAALELLLPQICSTVSSCVGGWPLLLWSWTLPVFLENSDASLLLSCYLEAVY